MRKIIAVAGALAINLALVVAFQRSADQALPVPNGEVTVTELELESVPTLAQAVTTKQRPATL